MLKQKDQGKIIINAEIGVCLLGKEIWIFPEYSYRYNSIPIIPTVNIIGNMEF